MDPVATGQVLSDSHVGSRVTAAVAFVNGLATAHAGGRVIKAPASAEERQARAAAALEQAGAASTAISATEAEELQQLATHLRGVFAAVSDRRNDDAAEILNTLLVQSGARPQLWRDPLAGWQLHYHSSDTGAVQGWTAGCAAGLAHLLTGPQAARLGICAAPRCDLVFVDTSRNGSRRFCSMACQNRVKAAAHRARLQRHQVTAGGSQ